jgi:hypothetical protein
MTSAAANAAKRFITVSPPFVLTVDPQTDIPNKRAHDPLILLYHKFLGILSPFLIFLLIFCGFAGIFRPFCPLSFVIDKNPFRRL